VTEPQQINHPILILIRGLPGSGKSYFATALQKSIHELAGENSVVMLDPDSTDYESAAYAEHKKLLTTQGVDPAIHAYRFLRSQAHKGISSRQIIIWNQPFTNLEIFNKMIANLQTFATDHNTKLSILVVEVEIDHSIAKSRVAKRKQQGGHGPSDKTFERFIGEYTSFSGEGYDSLVVRGEDYLSVSLSHVMEVLRNLRKN